MPAVDRIPTTAAASRVVVDTRTVAEIRGVAIPAEAHHLAAVEDTRRVEEVVVGSPVAGIQAAEAASPAVAEARTAAEVVVATVAEVDTTRARPQRRVRSACRYREPKVDSCEGREFIPGSCRISE